MLLIAIIGGFMFSVLWEAKSRYVLPYMIFSLPLAAGGVYWLQEYIKSISKYRKTAKQQIK